MTRQELLEKARQLAAAGRAAEIPALIETDDPKVSVNGYLNLLIDLGDALREEPAPSKRSGLDVALAVGRLGAECSRRAVMLKAEGMVQHLVARLASEVAPHASPEQLQEAVLAGEGAADIHLALGDWVDAARSLRMAGRLHLARQDCVRGMQRLLRSASFAERGDDPFELGLAQVEIGLARERYLHDCAGALVDFLAAGSIFSAEGDADGAARTKDLVRRIVDGLPLPGPADPAPTDPAASR